MVSLYEMRIDNQIYRTALCTFWGAASGRDTPPLAAKEKVPKNTVALHFLKKSAQKYHCTF